MSTQSTKIREGLANDCDRYGAADSVAALKKVCALCELDFKALQAQALKLHPDPVAPASAAKTASTKES